MLLLHYEAHVVKGAKLDKVALDVGNKGGLG
jgi:hypothetical protein